ncbi:MAG: helix-turn-helix domain-containing protein [Anaerolineae bacterium]|nr:helix-turn-helix domain-containing protein [Anaerolineae bacterium]
MTASHAESVASGRLFLTIPEAAEYLHVSERSVYRWLRTGRLRCFRLGNITRIALHDLEQFVQRYSTPEVNDDEHH